jgi:segregation and condensation protein B
MPEFVDEDLKVEAALFSAGKPLSIAEIERITGVGRKKVKSAIEFLMEEYASRDTAIEIVKIGNKYSMQLKERFADIGMKLIPTELPKDVLKTAALIGYHQPVKQAMLEEMIGSKVLEHIKILEDMGLIKKKREGRYMVIYITQRFAEYFGLEGAKPEDIKRILAERAGIKQDD